LKRNLSKAEVNALLRKESVEKTREATSSEKELLRNELVKQIQKCKEMNETEAVKNFTTLLRSLDKRTLLIKSENETSIHFEIESVGEQLYSETYFFIVNK